MYTFIHSSSVSFLNGAMCRQRTHLAFLSATSTSVFQPGSEFSIDFSFPCAPATSSFVSCMSFQPQRCYLFPTGSENPATFSPLSCVRSTMAVVHDISIDATLISFRSFRWQWCLDTQLSSFEYFCFLYVLGSKFQLMTPFMLLPCSLLFLFLLMPLHAMIPIHVPALPGSGVKAGPPVWVFTSKSQRDSYLPNSHCKVVRILNAHSVPCCSSWGRCSCEAYGLNIHQPNERCRCVTKRDKNLQRCM